METDNISLGQYNNTILIEINVKRPPRAVNVFLVTFLAGSLLIPFLIFYGAKTMEFPIGVGFLISLGIFAVSIGYFVRLYLWNIYGKEVFLIEKDEILFYNDYKYFKDNKTQIGFNKIKLGFVLNGEETFNDLKDINDKVEDCRFSILVNDREYLDSNILTRSCFLKKINNLIL